MSSTQATATASGSSTASWCREQAGPPGPGSPPHRLVHLGRQAAIAVSGVDADRRSGSGPERASSRYRRAQAHARLGGLQPSGRPAPPGGTSVRSTPSSREGCAPPRCDGGADPGTCHQPGGMERDVMPSQPCPARSRRALRRQLPPDGPLRSATCPAERVPEGGYGAGGPGARCLRRRPPVATMAARTTKAAPETM